MPWLQKKWFLSVPRILLLLSADSCTPTSGKASLLHRLLSVTKLFRQNKQERHTDFQPLPPYQAAYSQHFAPPACGRRRIDDSSCREGRSARAMHLAYILGVPVQNLRKEASLLHRLWFRRRVGLLPFNSRSAAPLKPSQLPPSRHRPRASVQRAI